MASGWTDDRVALMVRLQRDGHSCSIIGERLGVSRNAIIGKLHRLGLGLGHHRKPSIRKPNRGGLRAAWAASRRKLATPGGAMAHAAAVREGIALARADANIGPDLDVPEAERIKLDDLEAHHCRWPYGDGPFAFCGKNKALGSSYCDFHALRSANPLQPSRRIPPIMHMGGMGHRNGPVDRSAELREFDKMGIA